MPSPSGESPRLTTGKRLMRVETQLGDHLIACKESNARISKILFIGLASVLGVAAFGMTALYANVNSQSREIRDMLATAETQAVMRAAP